ncbi:Leucine-rich_repeat protein [Hexamita inflata]|uniref:Leucine-rich repeat protein n=1 Tax=Hexamita inflata TaxID=28002 RepID=A0AA86P9M2_9EUKA|nr:Leucine-rich repeat protein [Hexamita inflata]
MDQQIKTFVEDLKYTKQNIATENAFDVDDWGNQIQTTIDKQEIQDQIVQQTSNVDTTNVQIEPIVNQQEIQQNFIKQQAPEQILDVEPAQIPVSDQQQFQIVDMEERFYNHSVQLQNQLTEFLKLSSEEENALKQSKKQKQQQLQIKQTKNVQIINQLKNDLFSQTKEITQQKYQNSLKNKIYNQKQLMNDFKNQFKEQTKTEAQNKLKYKFLTLNEPIFQELNQNTNNLNQNALILRVQGAQPNLTQFKNLIQLSLHKCQLTQFSFSLNSLRSLDISFNAIDFIGELPPNLLELDLSSNVISEIPNVQMNQLQILKLNSNRFEKVPNLQNYPLLTILNLEGNEFRQLDLNQFQQCTHLKELNLSRNKFQNPLSQNFYHPNIEFLGLEMLNQSPEVNCFLPNLIKLDFKNDFTQPILSSFYKNIPNIQIINFKNNPQYTPSDLLIIQAAFPKLKQMNQFTFKANKDKINQLDYQQEIFEQMYYYEQTRHELPVKISSNLPGRLYVYQTEDYNNSFKQCMKSFQLSCNLEKINSDKTFITEINRLRVIQERADQLSNKNLNVQVNQRFTDIIEKDSIACIQSTLRKFKQRQKLIKILKQACAQVNKFKEISAIFQKRQQLRAQISEKQQIKLNLQKQKDLEAQKLKQEAEQKLALEVEKRKQENLQKNQQIAKQFRDFIKQTAPQFKSLHLKRTELNNQLRLKQVLLKTFRNHKFRNNLKIQLNEARNRLDNKQNLLMTLTQQFDFEDVPELSDKDFDAQDFLMQTEIKEALMQQNIYDIEMPQMPPMPQILPGIAQESYEDEAENQSQLIDSNMNSVQTDRTQQKQLRDKPKAIDPKNKTLKPIVSPDKAVKMAQQDGWNLKNEETAIAYYNMMKKRQKMGKKEETAAEKYQELINKRRYK